MHERVLSEGPSGRTICLVLEPGEEVMAVLKRHASARDLTGSQISAIGALQHANIAFFDLQSNEYEEIPVDEQVEVAALNGNIGRGPDGEVVVHAHVVLGRRDGSTLAGHLLSGTVRPTLEVILTEHSATLQRSTDEKTGLPLLRF